MQYVCVCACSPSVHEHATRLTTHSHEIQALQPPTPLYPMHKVRVRSCSTDKDTALLIFLDLLLQELVSREVFVSEVKLRTRYRSGQECNHKRISHGTTTYSHTHSALTRSCIRLYMFCTLTHLNLSDDLLLQRSAFLHYFSLGSHFSMQPVEQYRQLFAQANFTQSHHLRIYCRIFMIEVQLFSLATMVGQHGIHLLCGFNDLCPIFL